jgi:hypothetical protein
VLKSLSFELVDEIQITTNKQHKIHTLKHNELKSKKNNQTKNMFYHWHAPMPFFLLGTWII